MRTILISLVLLLIIAPFALAAENVQDDGTYLGEAGRFNFTGGICSFSNDTVTVPINGTVEIATATSVTVTATPNCRYKKFTYYNLRRVWFKQTGCI